MSRFLWIAFLVVLMSCASTKNYSPSKKYPSSVLQKDYVLLKNVLEAKHPSLYWYTPKDSMDMYFQKYYSMIQDSMTEQQFAWQVLSPLVDKIHCGHTSVMMSKSYGVWASGKRLPSFPLYLKVWNDTMAVTGSLIRNDSIFARGTILHSINGLTTAQITQKMFSYLPQDGYANTLNFIRISGNFPYFHRNIMGLSSVYQVEYTDVYGQKKKTELQMFRPQTDSAKKDSAAKKIVKKEKVKKKENPKSYYRSFTIDSSGYAVLTLNSFTKGNLRSFYRRTFRVLKNKNIHHLVLDIRTNSGGRVGLSTLLSKYISQTPFKVADTLFAKSRTVAPYTKHFEGKYLNDIQLFFISKKSKDGLYHANHLERKYYKPKTKNHFGGNTYVIISGPTFSAASLFCNSVKGQKNVMLIGEETGGGWYGNNGIMIPEFVLPNTKVRVSFPLFRLVQFNHVPQKGTGIPPDVYVGTDLHAIVNGYDKKMKFVKEMILRKLSEEKNRSLHQAVIID